MKACRVAVTGIGVVSPLGNTPDEMFSAACAGRSAIRHLEPPLGARLRSPIAATVRFESARHFPAARLRMLDRVSQYALVAAAQAVTEARLDYSKERLDRCGVFIGSGMGGAGTTDEGYHTLYAEQSDRINPYCVIGAMTNAPASWIAIEYGLKGPNLSFSTACSSSAVAVGEAARRISSGEVDIMLAGGSEAPLTFGVLRAWEAFRTLAPEDPHDASASCRPFSRNRSGLVLGEGAALLVLEEWERARARGAPIRAELSGYGLTCDAAHVTRPTAEGQASAMQAALAVAGLTPTSIGYLNAHGTATLQNDAVETQAIKQVFGACAYALPVSSTKAVHGHMLGAAGALEFAIALLCLEGGIVPPTMHLQVPDPECDLDYVSEGARRISGLNAVMSNSFAFGGTNATLIAERVRDVR